MTITRACSIVFSKDRAFQLEICLATMKKSIRDFGKYETFVLYTTTSARHDMSYELLAKDYKDVCFVKEENFKKDLLFLLGENGVPVYTHVMFAVDDSIFYRDFSMMSFCKYASLDDVFGFSLRLGKNTTYCYTMNAEQKIPDYVSHGNGVVSYEWKGAQYDFGYPFDVSSSIYDMHKIHEKIKMADYRNPNTFEANPLMHFSHGKYLCCGESSYAFSNPLNKVQDVAMANRSSGIAEMDQEVLLKRFLSGSRYDQWDIERLIARTPRSPHEEVSL